MNRDRILRHLYAALEHSEKASPETREKVYLAITRFMILQARQA